MIRGEWRAIVERAGMEHLTPTLPKGPLKILGASAKTVKGNKQGILTGVAYLLPARMSGTNLCAHSTVECAAACLGAHSGHLGMPKGSARRAQTWKSALWLGSPGLFDKLVRLDLEALASKAKRLGMIPAARLDGTTDLGASVRFQDDCARLGVIQYNYTKDRERALLAAHKNDPAHQIALSWTGGKENANACLDVIKLGGRIAVVFQDLDGAIGDTFLGAPIVNGDSTDAIFTQPPACVLGLSPKGRVAKRLRAKGRWLVGPADRRIGSQA